MSAWSDIEGEVVAVLRALTEGGQPLLATAAGRTARERKALIAAISRERMPAAYVLAMGRADGEGEFRRADANEFSVLIAQRSERGHDEARVGGAGVVGAYAIAERAVLALQDLLIGGDRRLLLIDEQVVNAEEGLLVWEQRYEVRREAEMAPPTFDGAALAGVLSRVRVEVGALQRAVSRFSFPGVDGVFERVLGLRGRPIVWRGQLRAVDDAGLNAIEAAIEERVGGGEAVMVDAWGRAFEGCVVEAFERRGPRRRDELSGEAMQDFELTFEQLGS